MAPTLSQTTIDCTLLTTRDINQQLKAWIAEGIQQIDVINPAGKHNLAVGIEAPVAIRFCGPVGYFCGGLSDGVEIEIEGTCGWSLGENLMSGQIVVYGNASANAGASARGGTIRIHGNAGPRTGISLKGATLVVSGNVGQSSAFMMQEGRLIICGNAGENLGDSMYEGAIYVGGAIASLGADARLDPMTDADWSVLATELEPMGIDPKTLEFKKVVCAKQLYHFKAKDFDKFKDAY